MVVWFWKFVVLCVFISYFRTYIGALPSFLGLLIFTGMFLILAFSSRGYIMGFLGRKGLICVLAFVWKISL